MTLPYPAQLVSETAGLLLSEAVLSEAVLSEAVLSEAVLESGQGPREISHKPITYQ